MTPELEPIEDVFHRMAIASGRPWPPDRWLGARARLAFIAARLDELRAEADAELRELEEIRRAHDLSVARGREILECVDLWCEVAEELAGVMAHEERSSPWAELARQTTYDVGRRG